MLKWLFSKPTYYQYPDTFGFNAATVDDAIRLAIEQRIAANDVVLVVCHFPNWFERFQRLLEQWNIDFEISPENITSKFSNGVDDASGKVFLALGQQLSTDEHVAEELLKQSRGKPRQLSIVIVERHPKTELDDHVVWFGQNSGMPTKLGYYLCFDHPLLDQCFGQKERQLLKHWTSIDDIVFSSTLASRRIRSVCKSKYGKSNFASDAFSVEDWFKSNESC